MKFNTIGRHFREGFKNIKRNGWMTFASVSAVTVTLLLVGIFLVIMLNLNHLASQVEKDVEIRVHVGLTASPEQQAKLEDRIKGISEVSNVTYSSKEQELTKVIESFGEEGAAFESLQKENPLNDVFIVKTTNPKDTPEVAKQIQDMEFASKVNYGQGTVEKLFSVVEVARNAGIILIAGLLFTAIFLISNTIKITIVARRKEIEIMKLCGATNGFIRWPFFVEGAVLGIMGAVLPIAAVAFGYEYLYDIITPRLETTFFSLLTFSPFVYEIAGILVLMGAFIGIWGSTMSVRKFLKV
ncbi:permease-like cell division protein FtsX [Bacillus marinisedimentorum]|uniref:permease-like cell division protein FtsX n=1 Tax=Bacillus marinisedimentorum TaxID=1821260 RepID=UPI0007E0DC4F|nr:permease-like cell division protein FtsX [Bacillus marinisedimentorum]